MLRSRSHLPHREIHPEREDQHEGADEDHHDRLDGVTDRLQVVVDLAFVVGRHLVERVLDRLGFSETPAPARDSLAALYQAVAYGEREAREADQVEASELLSAVSDDLVERSRRLAEAAQAASDRVGSDV